MRDSRWLLRSRRHENLFEHLCLLRGIDPLEVEPVFEKLYDPYLLPDMEKAVAVAKAVIDSGEFVTIFGDYDADGTPAAALLSKVFQHLGVEHEVILPTRTSGYGLKKIHIEGMVKTKLLITVDTGIAAIEEIALAKDTGIRTIILDHHLPKSKKDGGLPPADAVVDPFREDSTYPFKNLCGCALAYKFVDALSKVEPRITDSYKKWLLDLVAISTVADMMVLQGENRALVHYGLKVLQKNRRVGVRELLKVAAIDPATVSAATLGFALGPRLNASGRLSDNRPAYELLTTDDPLVAAKIAADIEVNNRTRQKLVKDVLEQARGALFNQNKIDDRFFLLHGETWPSGILGLVAGKLVHEYNRPVVVVAGEGDTMSGSGRSAGDFSLIDALNVVSDKLHRFGGHRQAAGLSLPKSHWAEVCQKLKEIAAQQIDKTELLPSFTADAEIHIEDISRETVRSIDRLAPFGFDNSRPIFLIRNIQLPTFQLMGRDRNHVKWRLVGGNVPLELVAFDATKYIDPAAIKAVDLIGSLEMNQWNGRETIQIKIEDLGDPGKKVETVN